MLQTSSVPVASFSERLRSEAGRRALGIAFALLVEALLLILLLTLGPDEPAGEKARPATVVSLTPDQVAEETPEPERPRPERQAEERPAPPQPAPEEPPRPQPAEPKAAPIAPPVIPRPAIVPPPAAAPASPAPPAPPSPSPPRRVYGPPDRGGSAAMRDSELVGTAPNGEPLYAASWYREPTHEELRGYLSTASGPGWGLIACRTAPDYRVEDCVALDEYPYGAQINRAVLAAAWQFKVRPPRLGGKSLVGGWVRIRIDYGIKRR